MLDLAEHIIETKRGKFDPTRFEDRYDDALAELVKAKAAGKPLPVRSPSRRRRSPSTCCRRCATAARPGAPGGQEDPEEGAARGAGAAAQGGLSLGARDLPPQARLRGDPRAGRDRPPRRGRRLRRPEARGAPAALRPPPGDRRRAGELGGHPGAEPRAGREAARRACRGPSARLCRLRGHRSPRASTAAARSSSGTAAAGSPRATRRAGSGRAVSTSRFKARSSRAAGTSSAWAASRGEKRENWLLIKGERRGGPHRGRPRHPRGGARLGDLRPHRRGHRRGQARPASKTGRAGRSEGAPQRRQARCHGRASSPPALATLKPTPPRGAAWVHEIKFDGYRLQAQLEGGKATLLTRSGQDWTDRFGAAVADALRALPAKTAILDGELVVEGAGGASDFSALQADLARRAQRPLPLLPLRPPLSRRRGPARRAR